MQHWSGKSSDKTWYKSCLYVLNAQIICQNALFIQSRLDVNFRQCLETSILLKEVFSMVIKKTSLQKPYELELGRQSRTVDLIAANRQFIWPEIYLVYNRSNKHANVYNSYNTQVASFSINNVSTENILSAYSVANRLKYRIDVYASENHMFYKQLVKYRICFNPDNFKKKIKTWKPDKFPCRHCKVYITSIGLS